MAISLLLLARQRTLEPSSVTSGYGYGASPRQRLASAGLSLGIAGGIGAALVFAIVAPEITDRVDPPITGSSIFLPQPVERDPEPPIDRPRMPIDSRVTLPPVDTRFPPVGDPPVVDGDTGITTIPGPVIGDGAGSGDQGMTMIPTPAPVWRDATRDPRFARSFQPNYPPALERERIEGTVQVRVRIGTNGRVISVENLGATDPAFFAATERQALRAWRFHAATRDGVPVESTQILTVRFELPADD